MTVTKGKTRKSITETFVFKKDSFYSISDKFSDLLDKHSKYILDIQDFEPVNNEDDYICIIEFKDLLSSEVFLRDLTKYISVDLFTKQRKSLPIKRFFLIPSFFEFEKSFIDLIFKYSGKISFYEEGLSKYSKYKILAIDFEDNDVLEMFTDEYEKLLVDYAKSSNLVELVYSIYFEEKVIEETTL